MVRKRIMVLGAAQYQVPLIQAVKDLGHLAYVASIKGNYPGIELADVFVEVDITDVEAAVLKAKDYKIEAVCTSSTDLSIPALGAIGEELNLPSIHNEQAYLGTNKIKMKHAFLRHGVPTAIFEIASTYEQAKAAANKIGFPVMVKVIDGMGGSGITKVCKEAELEGAWKRAIKSSKENEVIIEEFLEGLEFGAQAMTAFGKMQYVIPHNDTVSQPPYCSPLGHSYPANIPDSLQNEITSIVEEGMIALGLTHSHGNIDLILTNSGIKVIEIGPRVGATCLPELTSIHTGMNVYEQIVKLALNEKPDCNIDDSRAAASLFITVNKEGILKGYKIPEEIKNAPDIFRLTIYAKAGDKVRPFKIGRDRIGEVIVIADTWRKAEKRAEEVVKSIEFEIQ